MESLRDLVRRKREELGMTQDEFSEAVGMSQEWASNLETDRIKTPRKSTLRKLARVMNMDIADLYLAAGMADTLQKARDLADATPEYPEMDDDLAMIVDLWRDSDDATRRKLFRMVTVMMESPTAATRAWPSRKTRKTS